MNEKINLQELINLLSQKSGITKKEAELFLKECFDTVDEALLTDQSVKIKNLGSFKLSPVSARESIDVVTGARVLIPAHYKVNFSADNSLAQFVNEPFSYFDPVEVNESDEIVLSEEKIIFTEEEEEDVLAENQEESDFVLITDTPDMINKSVDDDDTETTEDKFNFVFNDPEEEIITLNKPEPHVFIEQPEITEIHYKEEKSKSEINKKSLTIKPDIIDKIRVELEGKPEGKADVNREKTIDNSIIDKPNITINNPNITIDNLHIEKPEQEEMDMHGYHIYNGKNKGGRVRKYLSLLLIPSYFVILAVVALIFYRLYRNPDSLFRDKNAYVVPKEESRTKPKKTNDPISRDTNTPFLVSDSIARIINKYVPGSLGNIQDSIKQVAKNQPVPDTKNSDAIKKNKSPNTPDKTDLAVQENRKKTEAAKKTTIKNGETLTRLAYSEYGNKCFWVYIYEENKNIIKNPHDVPAGLTITIPSAKKYKIDKNNPESIKRANEIADKLN